MSEATTEALPGWLTADERRVAAQFPRDIANHKLTVLRDDGLYRHLRCSQGSFQFWFEVVTWPGSLAIRGDMGGGWIFSRLDDMFQFFRTKVSSAYPINPSYWAEKLPDCGRSVKVHSEDLLKDQLETALAEYERDVYPDLAAKHEKAVEAAGFRSRPAAPMTPAEARRLVNDYAEDDQLRFADGARRLLSEFESADVVADPWEWDLTDWDWPFLWACHAIVWAIGQYDKAKAGESRG